MGFRAHPGARRRAALASSTSRLHSVTYRGGRFAVQISSKTLNFSEFWRNASTSAGKTPYGGLWQRGTLEKFGPYSARSSPDFGFVSDILNFPRAQTRSCSRISRRIGPKSRALAAISTLVVLVWTPGLSCSGPARTSEVYARKSQNIFDSTSLAKPGWSNFSATARSTSAPRASWIELHR